MAIVQVTLQQSYLGKDIFNVFHYLNYTNVGFGEAWINGLLNSFETLVVPAVNGVQVEGVQNVSVKAVQVENTNLQVTSSLSGNGSLAVANTFWLPAAQTYAVRMFVGISYDADNGTIYSGNRRITDGYKRFCGVSDGLIVAGDWLNTWAEGTEVDTLEERLAYILPTGVSGAADAEPIVYGKPIAGRPIDHPDGYLEPRSALFARVTSANLQPPRWTRGRQ